MRKNRPKPPTYGWHQYFLLEFRRLPYGGGVRQKLEQPIKMKDKQTNKNNQTFLILNVSIVRSLRCMLK